MSRPRAYAEETTVSVSRTREQINKLLRTWGCEQILWMDNFKEGSALLQLVWITEKGLQIPLEYSISLPTEAEIRAEYQRPPTKAQVEKRRQQRNRAMFRLLLLKLKADLNWVAAGGEDEISVFLSHVIMNDTDGVPMQIGQLVGPKLLEGYTGHPVKLLGGPHGRE